MKSKEFGSGYFGCWIWDENGLPAYEYTCNQINDPTAISPTNEVWRLKTDHSFLVGNYRVVGIASNYGYMQVRQDEGGPKFLNDFDPVNNHYGGGIGFLTDGKDIINTFYTSENAESFKRIFGIGYFKKILTKNEFNIEQLIFAPFGDDPIMISHVTITNNKNEPVNLNWFEYWDNLMYQFSYIAFINALGKKDFSITKKMRRELNKRYITEVKKIMNGTGIIISKTLKKYKDLDKDSLNNLKLRASFEDNFPPDTFLISLDNEADGICVNNSIFFGKGGLNKPDYMCQSLNVNLEDQKPFDALILQRNLKLKPKESKTMYFAYGYIPEGYDLQALIKKYQSSLDSLFSKSCEQWKKSFMRLEIPDEEWINREILWHNYYLQAAMSYDSYFKEHILSQGHVYQYLIGFQGAARDPCQHALPLIFTNGEFVKEVIRYTLKSTNADGEIPYGITGYGMIMPSPFKPSDLELWLLWLTSEYILSSKEIEFLEEEINTYPVYGKKAKTLKIKEMLWKCYKHFTEITGIGKHGLQRLSNGDWNDTVIIGHIPSEKHSEIRKVAESVLNSAMAIYTLKLYAEMLEFIGENNKAKIVNEYSESQKKAVHEQWTGQWFKRAWLSEELGWLGEEQLWLEPQPWAIIGNAANLEQKKILVDSIDKLVRKPSKIGAMLLSKGVKIENLALGVGPNAGVWLSINGTLIWALSLVSEELAWDEWKKNTLAFHAENYPKIWYGIWSGPDTYNSELSKYPGQTIFDEFYLTGKREDSTQKLELAGVNWTDFPVLNLHPHAWPLFNLKHLIGVYFTKEGLFIKPVLPKQAFKFSSSLFGFSKSQEGYAGWYFPKIGGNWKIVLKISRNDLAKVKVLVVNGITRDIEIKNDAIIFDGESTKTKPLEWFLKF